MQYHYERKLHPALELARAVKAIVAWPGFSRYLVGHAEICTNRFTFEISGGIDARPELGLVAPSIETILEPAISNPKCKLERLKIDLRTPLRLLSSRHKDGDDTQSLFVNGDESNSGHILRVYQLGLGKSWYQEYARELPKGAFKRDTATMKRWYQRIDREMRQIFPFVKMDSGIIE
ncbi:MAG TPA: hypothetical protein VI612_03390 [Candidatus Nanoarchaeia archaeon]|nr:hypothetical protein [Candidatus Nanoarchaeia archaeon]